MNGTSKTRSIFELFKKKNLTFRSFAIALLIGWYSVIPRFAFAESEGQVALTSPDQSKEPSDMPEHRKPDLHLRLVSSTDIGQQFQREASVDKKVIKDKELNLKPDPDDRRWSSFLPIWGEEAKKRGYELPLPFGVSGSFFYGKRDIDVNSVDVDIKNITLNVDKYAFVKVRSKEKNWSMRFDAWVLPFLNVYLLGGYTQEHTDVNIDVMKADIIPGSMWTNPVNHRTFNAIYR
jgi:hypothetical protein